MKDYNVVIAYENGTFTQIENFKADSKRDALMKLSQRSEMDKVLTITIVEKVRVDY